MLMIMFVNTSYRREHKTLFMSSLLPYVENLKQDIESAPAWIVAVVTFYAHSRDARGQYAEEKQQDV